MGWGFVTGAGGISIIACDMVVLCITAGTQPAWAMYALQVTLASLRGRTLLRLFTVTCFILFLLLLLLALAAPSRRNTLSRS